MEHIEKLDIVLKTISDRHPLENGITKSIIQKLIPDDYSELKEDNFYYELQQILDKLEIDGFVTYFIYPGGSHKSYVITFNGLIHSESGGYQQEVINENAENNRVEKLETFQKEQAVRLNRLTAYAVVASASFLLWEILKYFVFDHHWYRYIP